MEIIAKVIGLKKFATPRVIGGIVIAVIVIWALSIIVLPTRKPSSSDVAERPHDTAAPQSGTDEHGRVEPMPHGTTDTAATDGEQAGLADKGALDGVTHDSGSDSDAPVDHGTAPSPSTTASAAHATSPSHSKTAPVDHDNTPSHDKTATADNDTASSHDKTTAAGHATVDATKTSPAPAPATDSHATPTAPPAVADGHGATDAHQAAVHQESTTTHAEPTTQREVTHQQSATAARAHAPASTHGTAEQAETSHGTTSGHPLPASVNAPVHKPTPKGVAFVQAAIKPLRYELDERWWGWRPNDIIDVTDNINHFQLGVLEVTRRTAVVLAERIARTGTTDAFDENLEQATNWFMVKATSYWFPSAESKYEDSLDEMQAYLDKLKEGKATFYTRTDNLIPLLASFEDLLGSCDENLVKQFNEDGTPISSFAVDNYFFYTQGVASCMATILEAVHHDFLLTLESRNGTELLHHAIVSCQRAAKIEPWIILNSKLSSTFANHRANMAAPISHARFYLGQLIKTLST